LLGICLLEGNRIDASEINVNQIVDITLRRRSAIPSSPSLPIGRTCLRSEFSGFLFALAWHTERSLLLRGVIGELNDPFCSERVTVHCRWGGKPPKLPLPLWILSLCRRRTEPHNHRQHAQKFAKIARVAPEICSWTDRQTDTKTCSSQYFANDDVHMTPVRTQCQRRQSVYTALWESR